MPKDIKTRDRNKEIKSLNRNVIYIKNMRDRLLKQRKISKNTEENGNSNAVNYAIDEMYYTGRDLTVNTVYSAKENTRAIYKKIKYKKSNQDAEIDANITNENDSINLHQEENKNNAIKKLNNQKLIKEKENIRNQTRYEEAKYNILNSSNFKNNNRQSNNVKINSQQIMMKNHLVNKTRKNEIKATKTGIKKSKEVVKKSVNALKSFSKKIIAGLKSLTTIIASCGGIAVLIIIIAVIVAGMFGSAFGLLFSDEQPETEENMSVNSAVNFLDKEVDNAISKIKQNVDYDSVRIENRTIVWREVLSIYAVITTNRETKFNIMNMDDKNYEKLKEIFWKVVEIEHHTETYKVRVVTTDSEGNKITKTKTKTRLVINVESLSLDKMMDLYKMNKSERKQVEEMMNGQFDEMWEEILQ